LLQTTYGSGVGVCCKGGVYSRGYKYAGSNDINTVAWQNKNSKFHLHPVGTKRPNELGLYDMSGNVEEACWDEYGAYPNVENLNVIYTALTYPSQIEFTYITPSPIRKEETMVVHRNFIDEEMKELGLTYDGNSLYDNSLRVIEAKKKVVIDFIQRFENSIIKVLESVDDTERQNRFAVLQKKMEDRKYILDIRLKR
jgi:hypothetical protein